MAKAKKTTKLSDIDALVVGVAVHPFTWKGVGIARGKVVVMDPETFGVHERVGLVERNDAATLPGPRPTNRPTTKRTSNAALR